MTLRLPRSYPRKPCENALDYEIAQERAAALGRLGRALETALAALSWYDRARAERDDGFADGASTAPTPLAIRERLVRKASDALWCFVIQREACGLRDHRLIMRDYGVPREVLNRMGVFDWTTEPRPA